MKKIFLLLSILSISTTQAQSNFKTAYPLKIKSNSDSTLIAAEFINCNQVLLRNAIITNEQATTKRYVDSTFQIAERARVVTSSATLLATDRIVLVQNVGVAITITIPTSLEEVFIGRSLNSTGTITISYTGGTIESLAGTMATTTTLAAIATYGSGMLFRKDPNVTTRMLRVR